MVNLSDKSKRAMRASKRRPPMVPLVEWLQQRYDLVMECTAHGELLTASIILEGMAGECNDEWKKSPDGYSPNLCSEIPLPGSIVSPLRGVKN